MRRTEDPLAHPAPLIRRVYSYVAYRLGDGPEAEDVTSDAFERALRYRASYDRSRGAPLPWLLGIARHCADDALRRRPPVVDADLAELASAQDLEGETVLRLAAAAAINKLDDRSRDLLALRYGAELTAREIGEVIGAKTNAVEVALHRALARVRADLNETRPGARPPLGEPAPRIAP